MPPSRLRPTDNTPAEPRASLSIYQLNTNTSKNCIDDLINKLSPRDWDIVAIQEPPFTPYRNPAGITHRWEIVLPTDHRTHEKRLGRLMLLVSKEISTNCWKRLDFPSRDVSGIELKTQMGNVQTIDRVIQSSKLGQNSRSETRSKLEFWMRFATAPSLAL